MKDSFFSSHHYEFIKHSENFFQKDEFNKNDSSDLVENNNGNLTCDVCYIAENIRTKGKK